MNHWRETYDILKTLIKKDAAIIVMEYAYYDYIRKIEGYGYQCNFFPNNTIKHYELNTSSINLFLKILEEQNIKYDGNFYISNIIPFMKNEIHIFRNQRNYVKTGYFKLNMRDYVTIMT